MAGFNGFNSWDELADYIDNTMNISYTENPTSWVNAMKELMKGYKYVNVINETTGEHTTEIWPEDLMEGVGEVHIGTNTSSSSTVSGGGAKSAPTAKTIITDSTTQTAVVTEEATAVKDNGVVSGTKAINIIGGLIQIYGLITTGIEVANAQVWKDMSNYVFDSDFTEDTPVERVIDFLGNKIVNTITYITSDGELVVDIPDSIAQKMYVFLSNHMVEGEIPDIELSDVFNVIDLIYSFHNTPVVVANPNTYTFERYFSASNPTDVLTHDLIDASDDFYKAVVTDAISQNIGRGFNISNAVATALLASLDGVYSAFNAHTGGVLEDCQLTAIQVELNRGSAPPSKDTPVSLSEFRIVIESYRYPNGVLNIEEIPETGSRLIDTIINSLPTGFGVILAAGSSWSAGDLTKYLKRGKSGSVPTDYAYVAIPTTNSSPSIPTYGAVITYPSNEKQVSYNTTSSSASKVLYVNGYAGGSVLTADVLTNGTPNNGSLLYYSNLGYKGVGKNYEPDDYLVTAGIRSKIDANGNPELHPNPTKTKEEVYPELNNKKQQANPQARVESGAVIIDNQIVGYVPTSVPFGGANAQRIINHGVNNPDDPESYIDNRPQSTKRAGMVNTADPIDGINEDIETNINQYNESRYDPDHYPEPIPQNQPNPQYPTDPPVDTTGDSGDSPTPSTMAGVDASGMVSIYNPTKAQLVAFSQWLWSPAFFDNFLKLLQDPLDAVIGLHILYATPVTGQYSNIIVGFLDSGVLCKTVTQQYVEIDCGSVTVPEYYGDVLDYEPYVHVHIYLPFVGIVSVKPNDVIGKKVNIKYGVDVLTGTCLAKITTEKGESSITCYTFPGNCAVQVPLTGGSYASIIRAIASTAVGVAGSVVTGNALGAVGGVIGGVMSSHLDVSHSGTIGANAGAMGIRKPYIIITRKASYDAANYNQFYGFPANKTAVLGSCKGFTRVKSVHIDSISTATDTEKTEIETLLKQGVIIK